MARIAVGAVAGLLAHLDIAHGRAEGEASGLRQAVLTACELLGLEIDAQHQAEIDSLDTDGLERLLTTLRQNRSWPNE